ncbi:hypothetical protein Bca52824_037862 [Brassica carinata]|uniref:DUF4283 domain-containing protein n=1 Tax=Brassica carinata TaxID=52824 RepID=A0A8X7RNM1_BRACI|nr:hypothetical protein Bca52824_037862 [Brassica carinata]
MENPWFPGNSASAFSPPLLTTVTGTSLPNSSTVFSSPVKARSENTVHLDLEKLKVLPPKFSSPIISNKASNAASSSPPPSSVALTNHKNSPKSKTLPSNPTATAPSPIPTSQTSTSPFPPSQTCDYLRKTQDKSLTRLAPVTISDTGHPRVLIPDSAFQKGAELHKDFIICYFNGRPPPFNHVQNVLNHLWGKGIRVEIHTNPLSRSMLVRILSDYLRQKILEKRVWYVGDSFVPLDLRHQQGLILVAGLVGEPKETDDFTLNLVSLTMSHLKVAVDLTKPLPSVVEFTRQSGEVVEVLVTYPWIPPTCSHCKEIGYVMRNCLKLPPPPKKQPPPPRSSKTPRKNPSEPAEVAPVKNKDDICKAPSVIIKGATSSSSNATLKGKGVAESPNPPTLPPIPAPSSSSNSANTPSLPPPRPVSNVDPPGPSTTKKPDSQLLKFFSSPTVPKRHLPPPSLPKTLPPSTYFEFPSSTNNPFSVLSPLGSLPLEEPSLGTILESHIKSHNLSYLMNKLCRGWNYTSNHAADDEGRIILIWRDTVSVRTLHQSRQSVTCEVKIQGTAPFVYTAVYASNERAERTDLWVELMNTCQTFSLDSIIHPSEHSSTEVDHLTANMVELRDCFHQMSLYDLRSHGSHFTWSNKQPDSPITKKLDRLLINNQILNLFPNCTASFLPSLTSDHCPCLVDLAYKTPSHGTKPFKFYNYLAKHLSTSNAIPKF